MGLRPIGSEKLPVNKKIIRIMEIANYQPNTESTTDNGIEYSIEASNNKVYGIVRENSNYIIKEGDSLDNLGYVNGMRNSKKETFRSYGAALKRLNLIMNEVNSEVGNNDGMSLYGEQEKFTLKTPEVSEPEMDMDMDLDLGSDDMDMGDDEEEFDMDMGDDEDGEDEEDMSLDMDSEEEGETNIKAIQKLTGKLGQKLRDLKDEMEGDDIKYVINSIISAVNLEKLSEEDVEDILGKFEDEEIDYSEEGEYELDSDGDEEFDMDMGDDEDGEEEIEMDLEMGETEDPIDEFWGGIAKAAASGAAGAAMNNMMESGGSVDRTISKYFKESKSEEISKKQLIESFIDKKITNNVENEKVSKYCLSYEQEVTSTKLMEKYNVNFKGRNKQGDLLFIGKNVKFGITKGGKVIK